MESTTIHLKFVEWGGARHLWRDLSLAGQTVGDVELTWWLGCRPYFSVSVKCICQILKEYFIDLFGEWFLRESPTATKSSRTSLNKVRSSWGWPWCRWSRQGWWWWSWCRWSQWRWSAQLSAWLDLADYRVPEDQRSRRLLSAAQHSYTHLATANYYKNFTDTVSTLLTLCAHLFTPLIKNFTETLHFYWHYGHCAQRCQCTIMTSPLQKYSLLYFNKGTWALLVE